MINKKLSRVTGSDSVLFGKYLFLYISFDNKKTLLKWRGELVSNDYKKCIAI